MLRKLLLLFFLLSFTIQYARSDVLKEHEVLYKGLIKDYTPTIRPAGKNGTGPVHVNVNMYIRSLSNFDEDKMTYDAQLTFRQEWNDKRLTFIGSRDIKYITVKEVDQIWMPDTFFSNERDGHFHNLLNPNTLIRIYPNGTVLLSLRISLTLSCPMNFQYFPMDSQDCSIVLASYAYTTDDIVYIWKNDDPIQITRNLHLTKYTLNGYMTDYCTSKTNTGTYSCMRVEMNFKRTTQYYFIRTYIPTACQVILSWLALFLNPERSNMRIGICLAVIICNLIVLKASLMDPKVSYTKAIDVWTGTCLTFVVAVLFEVCIVSNMVFNEQASMLDHEKNAKHSAGHSIWPLRWLNRQYKRSQQIDIVFRILFPLGFIVFNIIYWSTYSGA